jgi:nucleotide-binding universal stress UspA family protein
VIKMDRILCPVDFSPFSRHALDHAALLAARYQAELLVLHVVPLMPSMLAVDAGLSGMPLGPVETEAVRRELQAFAKPVEQRLHCQVVLREGPAAAGILHEAEEGGADLIVLGTHGRSGFERWMLGSVTEKVLRKAPCPVLTVPRAGSEAPLDRPAFRRLLCAVDFSEASARAATYAFALAQEAKAHLILLHVVEWLPSEDFVRFPQFDTAGYRRHLLTEARVRLEKMVPAEARQWCETEERIACGKPYREILRVAGIADRDLLVLGVHGHNAVDRLLYGSTTDHVVRQATCPVLTVRS